MGLYPPEYRPALGDAGSLTPVGTFTRGNEPMYGTWFASCDSCPRVMQALHELYSRQEKFIR